MYPYKFPKIPREAFSLKFGEAEKIKRLRPKAKYPMVDTYPHGMPLGGFGAGTIGRQPDGDFAVWHLLPGYHIFENVSACQFSVRQRIKHEDKLYAQVLSSTRPEAGKPLSGWNWGYPAGAATYHALYPKAWTEYRHKKFPVQLQCTQFSPVLPHNYKETSYPVAVFKWNAYNPTNKVVEVSIMLTWQNMLGWKPLPQVENSNVNVQWKKVFNKTSLNTKVESGEYHGVILTAPESGDKEALNGEFCIATQQVAGSKIFVQTIFDCEASGEYMWAEFQEKGRLSNYPNPDIAAKGAAIIVKFTLGPKDALEVPMVITWDLPKALGLERYYTKFYGRGQGGHSFKIAKDALTHYKEWEQEIDKWHNSFIARRRPVWYTRMLFNELYYLADGGTIWDAASGRLAYLESYDYVFYDTLDVRYYGSFPLAYFWPELEKTVIKGFASTVNMEDRTPVVYNKGMDIRDKKGQGRAGDDPIYHDIRKRKGACPHDLGSPFEQVFEKVNAYLWQNSNRWKDLNSKFILQAYRAYVLDGRKDKEFLAKLWPSLMTAAEYLDTMDPDHDHLPENEGFPDQTFDNWTMQGTSAYCGGLRVAALTVTAVIGEVIGERQDAQYFRRIAKLAEESLMKKLWNGKYFDFCEGNRDIMAAQLAGHWYLDLFDVRQYLTRPQVTSIFRTIYASNFLKFAGGALGVVNGRTAQGGAVKDEQGNDVWVGINFMLSAHFLIYGLWWQAWRILRTIYNVIYQRGFFFRTPEAWDERGGYIASMYMRAGTIWTVEYALSKNEKKQKQVRPG
jgi:non-lysosomal glucosylceramidase